MPSWLNTFIFLETPGQIYVSPDFINIIIWIMPKRLKLKINQIKIKINQSEVLIIIPMVLFLCFGVIIAVMWTSLTLQLELELSFLLRTGL